MKLREIRALNESTQEGVAGAVIGGTLGAVATKTPSGAMMGAKIGSGIQDALTDNDSDSEVEEGVMSEIDIFLTNIAENPDDGFDKIYNALTGDEGEPTRRYLQNMYDKISINKRLHPDDDFEEIIDVMIDYIEADYGTKESVEESKDVPQYAVRVGDREVTFEDQEEANRFISLAKLGGIKAEAVTVTKKPAQPASVVTTDAGQEVEFSNDQDAQQFAQKLKQGQAQVGNVKEDDQEDVNPVASAITRRIINAHRDLLMTYGPEAVTQAIDDVAEYVGDVEEIGSSDVSGWVKQVEKSLKSAKESIKEKAKSPYAVGMAQAMKSTGDKPPLEKSTIKKAHEIAKKVIAKEDEAVAESIEQIFEEQTYTVHVDNAHDFDLDDDRGIDRSLQTVFKDAGVNVIVDPHDTDSTKAVLITNQDINELLEILDQNGIQAHVVDQQDQEPKESVTEGVLDDSDDSGFMAKSNLYIMIKDAVKLHEMIGDKDELEGWVEEKITLATDYIKTVKDYLEYNKARGVDQQTQPAEPEMVTPESTTLVDDKELADVMALTSRLTKR